MEQRNENPVFGRKVFFVNPPLSFEKIIVAALRNQEFEVYVINDFRNCKAILRDNPDSMCFIYIDSEMNYLDWFKFLKTFQQDPAFNSIFIGLMSGKIPEDKRNFFLMNSKLPGGFTMLNVPNNELLKTLLDNLVLNGAKGRRKYIRLDTTKMEDVKGFIAAGGKLFPFEVQNISSVGFAVKCSPVLTQLFVKDAVVPNISCTLGTKTALVTVQVFDTKLVDGKCSSVLMLKDASEKLKNFIRDFIFSKLDERLSYDVKTCLHDDTDYHEMKIPKADGDVIIGSIDEMDADDLEDTRDHIIVEEKEVREERNFETKVVKKDDDGSGKKEGTTYYG